MRIIFGCNDCGVEWGQNAGSRCPRCDGTISYSTWSLSGEVGVDRSSNKYKRTVPSLEIDIYDVIKAWDIRCPARQHALKKIMCAGERGAKGVVQDLEEAIQALQRAKELVG